MSPVQLSILLAEGGMRGPANQLPREGQCFAIKGDVAQAHPGGYATANLS